MAGSETVRVVIADDEPLARKRVRRLLKSDPDVEVAGECATGAETVAAIRSLEPDLVFLDIQMPEMDGFDVFRKIGAGRMPLVVFVTAHDQYAARAFEVAAVDYLLKPFNRARFEMTLQRAKKRLRMEKGSELGRRTLALLRELGSGRQEQERLVVKTGGRLLFIKTAEIDWIEAEDNYVRVRLGRKSYLLRDTLTRLESALDPAKFARIHRGAIVNISRIQELQPAFHGDYRVILEDGTQLNLSRNYRGRLRDLPRISE